MEYDVFISYSRKDTAIVDQFVNRLTEASYRVWIDRDDIDGGDQFDDKIAKAIKNSSIVVFFSSANSNISAWTIMEVSYSLKKGKTIIPVRLDDSDYADSIDLRLVNINFINYNPSQPSSTIDRLISSVSAHLTKPTTPIVTKSKDASISTMDLYLLGKTFYDSGEYERGITYLRMAAEQGDSNAQCYLGNCYENGLGVQQDYQQAVELYCKAAEQGHAHSQFCLGKCYSKGLGVQHDCEKAARWYSEAAKQGDPDAQFNLGLCYKNGEGVGQDYSEAFKMFLLSAEQGHVRAQCRVGFCFDFGKGTTKDKAKAVKWYRKAAEQGNVDAQVYLALCYENGLGVDQNKHEAIKWYRKAAEKGFESAIEALKRLHAL